MLPAKYDFQKSEKRWQEYWEKEGIFKFDRAGEGPLYSIDTPPPTVSGAMHIGHIYSYTQIEIIARFWRMKGYRVFFPFGFDDNGLATERLVEKKKGIKAGNFKREDFRKLCLELTEEYEEKFKKLWQSVGFSVDWSLEYSTINSQARYISQLSFLDLYHKGRIYREKTPVLWCGNCQTSIAQAELDLKEEETLFNYLGFKTNSGEDLLIATTRPELLPACVAILIHPADQKNAHLIGKKAIVPLFRREVPILGDQAVDREIGSGIVMCCTFGDQQDIKWWRKYKLPLNEIIDREGKVKKAIAYIGGLKLASARKKILEELELRGFLFKQEALKHQLACHERCDFPVEFISSEQWYIKIMDQKKELWQAGEEINWHPVYMKHRYQQWVANLQWDWCISRQRFFGVPFPVWYCKECGQVLLADQKQLPVNPLEDKPLQPCRCGSTAFTAESDVMDTWATSSLTPLINAGWQGGKELLNPLLPMNLRPQAHDIIRTWTFYTIVKILYHFKELPWQDIMISGFVLAGKKQKLSKSKGNTGKTPQELISKYSADVIRLWAGSANLGADIFFSEAGIRDNQKLPIKLWNAARFSLQHLQGLSCFAPIDFACIDRWIIQRTQQSQQKVTAYLERFEISQAREELAHLFWSDFCDNYLEIIKERLYQPEVRGKEARLSAQQTLYIVLLNILKMYAVFIPHLTEEIYQDYYRSREGIRSIHLLPWGFAPESSVEEGINEVGVDFIKLLGQIRKFKTERGLSLGQELRKILIDYPENNYHIFARTLADLKAVSRTKMIEMKKHSGNEPLLEISL